MPKIVDHEARRGEIAQALWRVIAREGMAGASARTVAAESGWSLGAVRHYFPSQAGLLRFAAEAMLDGAATRVRELLDTVEPGPDRAQALVEQLLPLDTQRAGEVQAWLAVLVDPSDDPVLRAIGESSWVGTRHLARLVVRDLTGGPTPGLDDGPLPDPLEAEAARLHGWIDGLTLQAVTVPDRHTPDRLRAQVRHCLALLPRDS